MGLDLINVSKVFANSTKHTVKDISFHAKNGEFISIIGPSGCGKSTILNMIAGLEKPTSGQILLDGKLIQEPGSDRVMMFQESALFPWLNVIDNLKFGMKIAKKSKEEQEEIAMKYLKMVELSKFKDYNIYQLSGGMKQRVALARALALDSKILLMDEPFAALDNQTKNMLHEEIQKIWMETKKTVVFVTHSVEEAIFFGDKIIMLSANPARIKLIYDVKIERPRHKESQAYTMIRAELLNLLRVEVMEDAKKEYDAF